MRMPSVARRRESTSAGLSGRALKTVGRSSSSSSSATVARERGTTAAIATAERVDERPELSSSSLVDGDDGDSSSEVVELDWRGTVEEFAVQLVQQAQAVDAMAEPAQLPAEDSPSGQAPRGPGRPKLGVVARAVTLLPRHWEWLATQPGGASVALRKLVEVARHASERKDEVARCSAVGYKFMSTIAGNAPGFEEASRALFAGDAHAFEAQIARWPADVQAHLQKILANVFEV